jgi:hypothetical protein
MCAHAFSIGIDSQKLISCQKHGKILHQDLLFSVCSVYSQLIFHSHAPGAKWCKHTTPPTHSGLACRLVSDTWKILPAFKQALIHFLYMPKEYIFASLPVG